VAFNRVMRVPAAFVEEHRACGELDGGADENPVGPLAPAGAFA